MRPGVAVMCQAGQVVHALPDFDASPVGQARTAHGRGDALFQCSLDLLIQQAVVVAIFGSATTRTLTDSNEVLNAIAAEGWELVDASTVFVEQGRQARDKFMSSGPHISDGVVPAPVS